jgi:hypothetical protein
MPGLIAPKARPGLRNAAGWGGRSEPAWKGARWAGSSPLRAVELEGRAGVARAAPGFPIGAVSERVGHGPPARVGQPHRRTPGVKMVLLVGAGLLAKQAQPVGVIGRRRRAGHRPGADQGSAGIGGVADRVVGCGRSQHVQVVQLHPGPFRLQTDGQLQCQFSLMMRITGL